MSIQETNFGGSSSRPGASVSQKSTVPPVLTLSLNKQGIYCQPRFHVGYFMTCAVLGASSEFGLAPYQKMLFLGMLAITVRNPMALINQNRALLRP